MRHICGGKPHIAGTYLTRFVAHYQTHAALNDDAHLLIGMRMHGVDTPGFELDPAQFLIASDSQSASPPDLHVGKELRCGVRFGQGNYVGHTLTLATREAA